MLGLVWDLSLQSSVCLCVRVSKYPPISVFCGLLCNSCLHSVIVQWAQQYFCLKPDTMSNKIFPDQGISLKVLWASRVGGSNLDAPPPHSPKFLNLPLSNLRYLGKLVAPKNFFRRCPYVCTLKMLRSHCGFQEQCIVCSVGITLIYPHYGDPRERRRDAATLTVPPLVAGPRYCQTQRPFHQRFAFPSNRL